MKRFRFSMVMLLVLVAALCQPAAQAASLASARLTPTGVEWQPAASYEGMVLTVSGPDGVILRREFRAGTAPSLDLFGRDGNPLPDGVYNWELSAAPQLDPVTRSALVAARKTDDAGVVSRLQAEGKLPRSPLVQSGVFSVAGGAIVPSDLDEERKGAAAGPAVRSKALTPTIAEDQVIPDDLIVQGSGCFGFDCVNNESFGFDTIRLKENNTRIKFEDTSVGTFPTNDWQLTANDSASGGASKFSIEDITGAKVPFTVTAGASTNSIFVDSTGRVGFRTSTPVLDLHVNTSNTPSMRLEQNNSGGFTAQTWDIAGNEANFFVRDVTGGSRLPFRIRPGAPTSSVDISADGDVGIGTASPDAKLDIEDTGSVDMRFTLTGSNVWRLVNDFNGFGITFVGSGLREFNIGGGGNVTISGTLTQGSSRDIKDNFLTLDPKEVLAKVSALPLSQWSYKTDGPAVRHIGPMAEDFHKTFGLGTDDKHIAPSDQSGVALLAVQGLNQVVQEKDKEIADLKQANADLKTRLENLEKVVEKLAAEQQ